MQNTLQKPEQNKSYKPVKNLLSPGDTNIKTAKNILESYIMYMAPADTVQGLNLALLRLMAAKKYASILLAEDVSLMYSYPG